ncbi:MAG: 23S rRNA (pseudouridine(1915)-N(3))-methyltransferase RlmH [Betaproteobacteria bacterium]
MKIWIISVGHKMPQWVELATQDYLKRMPKECAVEVKELKPDINPAKEATKIKEAIPKNSYVIALDEKGINQTTLELSKKMDDWCHLGKDISLIIGGADGLAPDIKEAANELWRLSSLTLPHGMVRVLLTEQLYRAWTILQGHPYHRE